MISLLAPERTRPGWCERPAAGGRAGAAVGNRQLTCKRYNTGGIQRDVAAGLTAKVLTLALGMVMVRFAVNAAGGTFTKARVVWYRLPGAVMAASGNASAGWELQSDRPVWLAIALKAPVTEVVAVLWILKLALVCVVVVFWM